MIALCLFFDVEVLIISSALILGVEKMNRRRSRARYIGLCLAALSITGGFNPEKNDTNTT